MAVSEKTSLKYNQPPRRDSDGAANEMEFKPPFREHAGDHKAYLRDAILGVNDGLVSIFLLILGLAGGGLLKEEMLLAALAASVAGAISMSTGEYLATKSQNEVLKGEMKLEREHFKHYREQEIDQVKEVLSEKLLLQGDLLEQVVKTVGESDEALMNFMMAFEFGGASPDEEPRNPFVAMMTSGGLFMFGALPSIIPWLIVKDEMNGVFACMVSCGVMLFAVGAAKTILTKGNPIIAGLENCAWAAAGGVISYYIGVAYEKYHPHIELNP